MQKGAKGLKAGSEHLLGHAKHLLVDGINGNQLLIGDLFLRSKLIAF